jgi:hypothetical protein
MPETRASMYSITLATRQYEERSNENQALTRLGQR